MVPEALGYRHHTTEYWQFEEPRKPSPILKFSIILTKDITLLQRSRKLFVSVKVRKIRPVAPLLVSPASHHVYSSQRCNVNVARLTVSSGINVAHPIYFGEGKRTSRHKLRTVLLNGVLVHLSSHVHGRYTVSMTSTLFSLHNTRILSIPCMCSWLLGTHRIVPYSVANTSVR